MKLEGERPDEEHIHVRTGTTCEKPGAGFHLRESANACLKNNKQTNKNTWVEGCLEMEQQKMKEGISFFTPTLGLFLHLSTDVEHQGERQVCFHSSPPDRNLLESLLQALQDF